MEMILYTIAALLLYGISDYILNAIEVKAGKRLPNRSLIFFVIISILAVSSFAVIQTIYKNQMPQQSPGITSTTASKTTTSNSTQSEPGTKSLEVPASPAMPAEEPQKTTLQTPQ